MERLEKYKGLEKIVDLDQIKYNEPMKNHTTTKVGGNCDCLILPKSIDEIKNIIKYSKENNISYYVIGGGSNLIVADSGINALIIKINSKFSDIEVKNDEIIAKAGARMPLVSLKAKENSLKNFEFACGIPGTVGGGVRMNAGAYGGEIKDIFVEAKYLDEEGNVKVITKKDMDFGYRHSYFTERKNLIILEVKFKLEKGNINEIEEKMNQNFTARKEKQPLEYPNFGSVFKRPEGYFAGKLITDANLKGYKIGGAMVSTKHAGFIVNTGNATCKDVLDLIEHIQKTVFEKFGVKLETEVVYIGGKVK